MKQQKIKQILILLPLTLILFGWNAAKAQSNKIMGKVTFVGTIKEVENNGVYQAAFRIRVSDSTCTGDNVKKTRWVRVYSGRMDGKFIHNMANFRNAYSTVLTAFVSKKNVEITNVRDCDAESVQTIRIWNAAIGVF